MNRINLRTLDLNLLRVFLALADTGSVSKAAVVLGMSQPATSSALSRLRGATGDRLFLRSRDGMLPTPFAEAILPDIRHHLNGLFDSLGTQGYFDPATSDKTFRLSLSGLGELVFVPRLLQEFWANCPDLKIVNSPTAVQDLAQALERNQLDCAIGIIDTSGSGLRTQDLFSDTYVVVAGQGLTDDPEDLDGLRSQRFVISSPEVSYAADIERLLVTNRLADCIHLRLGHFGAIPSLLDFLPLLSVLPEQLAKHYAATGKVRVLPIELLQTRQIVRLIWHERTNEDSAQAWFRATVIRMFGQADMKAA